MSTALESRSSVPGTKSASSFFCLGARFHAAGGVKRNNYGGKMMHTPRVRSTRKNSVQ